MTAYLAARVRVKDPEALADYSRQAAPIMAEFGGGPLFKGAADDIVEGASEQPVLAVFAFPNKARARAFLDCAAYQPLIPGRTAAADITFSIHEGA